ncbi:hypothetical protein GCM10018790_77960 [Kitasatospora xanthocidica]|uniref:zeta toxin family protein n=1 Tax=Kitasatospora xanthocidica TaxID=83382 RepID=UPI0016783970|nr:zeta toxin family protein [Kitasatospora xanthocidica]GHF88993.1 hypothetical protein GCM10018790_77960 [Kitasatospora xanthocidica]
MADPDPYELTPEQLRERFDRVIEGYVFGRRRPSDQPIAVLTGAQPAAGKSQAMENVRLRNADRDVIRLSGDELRQFHPQFRALMDTDPIAMVPATQQAATAWMQMAFAHAVEHGYSFVAEGTFRNAEAVLADARFFATGRRGDGSPAVSLPEGRSRHEVWVVALAVRAERSRLDAMYRYLSPGMEPGRWVWPEWANASYTAIPGTVAAAEESPHVHRVIVTNRTGEDLYVNTRRPDGTMEYPPGAGAAVLAERARPLPVQDADGWLARQQDVVLQFVATGQVDTTTHEGLSLALEDARAVIPMSSAADGPARLDAEALQDSLSRLLGWAHEGPWRQRPVYLLPDSLIEARLDGPDGRQYPLRRAELAAELDRRAALSRAARAAEDAIHASAQSLVDLRRAQRGDTAAGTVNEPVDGLAQGTAANGTALSAGQGPGEEEKRTRTTAQAGSEHPFRDVPDADLAATLARVTEEAAAARDHAVHAESRAVGLAAALASGGEVEQGVAERAKQVDAILDTRYATGLVERLSAEIGQAQEQAAEIERQLAERGVLGRQVVRGADRDALGQRAAELLSSATQKEDELIYARDRLESARRLAGPADKHDIVLEAWQEAGGDRAEVLARTAAARQRGVEAARAEVQEARQRASGLGTSVGLMQQELDRRGAQPPAQRAAEDAQRVLTAQRQAQQSRQTRQDGPGLGREGQGRSGPSASR